MDQNRWYIERHVRQPDGTWVLTVVDAPVEHQHFATLDLHVPIAEIYYSMDDAAPETVN